MRLYLLTSDTPDLPPNAFRKSFWSTRPATLEGGKGGSSPAAPDPYTTAAATTQTNQQTAAYNKALNLNNYQGLLGAQATTHIADDPQTGAPIYSTFQSANPLVENQFNSLFGQIGQGNGLNSQIQSGLNGLQANYGGLNDNIAGLTPSINALSSKYGSINQGLAGLGSQLNQGAALKAQQQGQDAAYKAQTQYLDPQFSQQGESLSASLANSGLTPGSEAYNNAMTNFNNQKQQAYSNAQNQAVMTGSQLGAQNLQNQIAGINTQAGLFGQQASNLGQQGNLIGQQAGLYGQLGSNLSQQGALYGQQGTLGMLPYQQLGSIASLIPGYSGVGQSSANAADIAGNINNQYQAQLAGHNADVQSANGTTSAIAGLAGAAALAFF
jgi:hypothetical protein